MFICDMHTHSRFSFDADPSFSPDALCRAAIEKGISDIAITDHFEANFKTSLDELTRNSVYDHASAYAEIMAAKDKYRDKINLIYGIEIGQANQSPLEACELLNQYDYEFVIGSIHNLSGMGDFYYMNLANVDDTQIGEWLCMYFNELCQIVDTMPKIDTVAHITYLLRYLAFFNRKFDIKPFYDTIASFYKKIIGKDIALEVNTSTLLKGLGFTMPSAELLKLYRECGGRLITVGSDAHSAENLAGCVIQAFDILKECGFDSVLTVRNGQKDIVRI
ncbi:MAG: histidinol-phosphatase HisJ family protein [Ruminococcaceae bacterium]|nr:histidinol-phosphatase HisJ family protein [Oscillospiraceae bacterium]